MKYLPYIIFDVYETLTYSDKNHLDVTYRERTKFNTHIYSGGSEYLQLTII